MQTSDVISLIALVVSLIAGGTATWVGYHSSRRDMVATTYANANTMLLEIDSLLVAFPEYLPYLYDKKQLDAAEPQRGKVIAATHMVLDIAEYIWERRNDIRNREDRDAWEAWLLSLFESSIVLRDLYDEQPDWYPNLQNLRREAPTPDPTNNATEDPA